MNINRKSDGFNPATFFGLKFVCAELNAHSEQQLLASLFKYFFKKDNPNIIIITNKTDNNMIFTSLKKRS